MTAIGTSPSDNSPPLAVDDRAETATGAAVLIDVLPNDRDPDGGPLRISAFTFPAHGIVSLLGPGTFRYTPQPTFVGIDYFSYTVIDDRGEKSAAWVAVTVHAANRPPMATGDHVTTERDQAVAIDVLANDGDPDGDPLTLVGLHLPARGRLAVNQDQTITYTPDAGFVGIDSFGYVIGDGRGGTDRAEVRIVVEMPNAAPTALPDHASTVSGTPVRIDVLANDSDPDGDALTLVALVVPVHGFLVVNQDRTITYMPDAGFVGVDDFAYTVADGKGGSSTAGVTIDVTEATNGAPTAIALDNLTVAENAPGAVVGKLSVSDPDADDKHVLSVDDARFEIVGEMLKLRDGVALDFEAETTVPLAITATDAGGLSLTRSFTLTVVDVDEAPAPADDVVATLANRAVTIPVLANDDDPTGRPLTIVAVTDAVSGSAVVSADGTITYTPDWGFIGEDSFTYTAANDIGVEAQAAVTITVNGDGEPFSDGTFFTDGSGWVASAAA